MTVNVVEQSTYLKQLFAIKFERHTQQSGGGNDDPDLGVLQIKRDTVNVIRQMIIDNQEDQLEAICKILGQILDNISSVVGDWISTFIPDDAGLVGITIRIIVNALSVRAFGICSALFNRMPPKFRDLLKYPDQLKAFLDDIAVYLEEMLRQKAN